MGTNSPSNNADGAKAEPKEVGILELADFLPKQLTAFEAMADYRFILYGGARGGGKSHFLRWTLLIFLIYHFKINGLRNVEVMLACETYPELTDRQVKKIVVEFPAQIGKIKTTRDRGFGFYVNEKFGGGLIALRNLDDPAKYKSAEFAAIAIDELTMNEKSTFDLLRGSLRWPKIPYTKFIGATNPGGIGHAWVKRLWIDKKFPSEMLGIAPQFKFIQSLPIDNPYLDEVYWDDLNSLPDELRKAWVDGNWDVFVGMAFTGFRRHAQDGGPWHVIKQAVIPPHWPRWRAVDSGYTAPFCCLWGARDPDNGRIIIYRELHETQMTDKQQARAILDLSPDEEGVSLTYADPSMWTAKNVQGIVSSSADEYLENGVPLIEGDNARINGKRKVDKLLMKLPDGIPGLLIMENCTNLISNLANLALDKVKIEDVDTKQDDHAYDTLRYFLTNVKTQSAAREEENKQEQEDNQPPLRRLSRII